MYLSANHSASSSEGTAPLDVRWASNRRRPQLLTDVFEHFPFGIIVVDPSHGVMASNRAARDLVTIPAENGHGPATCCQIFGCGHSGTPLSSACLTEIALAAGEKTPEVFLEPPSAPGRLVGVTAAPLYADGSHIIFQVRQATAADRSASAENDWLEQ